MRSHDPRPSGLQDEEHLLVGGERPQVVGHQGFELVGSSPDRGHGRAAAPSGMLRSLLLGVSVVVLDL